MRQLDGAEGGVDVQQGIEDVERMNDRGLTFADQRLPVSDVVVPQRKVPHL